MCYTNILQKVITITMNEFFKPEYEKNNNPEIDFDVLNKKKFKKYESYEEVPEFTPEHVLPNSRASDLEGDMRRILIHYMEKIVSNPPEYLQVPVTSSEYHERVEKNLSVPHRLSEDDIKELGRIAKIPSKKERYEEVFNILTGRNKLDGPTDVFIGAMDAIQRDFPNIDLAHGGYFKYNEIPQATSILDWTVLDSRFAFTYASRRKAPDPVVVRMPWTTLISYYLHAVPSKDTRLAHPYLEIGFSNDQLKNAIMLFPKLRKGNNLFHHIDLYRMPEDETKKEEIFQAYETARINTRQMYDPRYPERYKEE